MKATKTKILFLCTGNSCRSQMAEAFARHLHGESLEAHSAGVDPKGIDPRAVRAMAEVGIDISTQDSKSIDAVKDIEFDYVITLCDHAQQTCPRFPAKTRVLHASFEDPPRLAAGAESDAEAMEHYRRVRDQIREFIRRLPQELAGGSPAKSRESLEAGIRAFLGDLPPALQKSGGSGQDSTSD